MDSGAFEVSTTVDGQCHLRNDWLLLLHHASVCRWQAVSYLMSLDFCLDLRIVYSITNDWYKYQLLVFFRVLDRYLFISVYILAPYYLTSHSDHERCVSCVADYIREVLFHYIEHASSLVKQITVVWPKTRPGPRITVKVSIIMY